MNNKNTGKRWSNDELVQLRQLAKGNTPTGLIASKLQRSEDGIRAKAGEKKISLKPTNQSTLQPPTKKIKSTA